LGLSGSEVHVWRAELDVSGLNLCGLEGLLSSDEMSRANRFHFQRDRARFVAARGTLRMLLGRYLGAAASALQFCYGRYGKPYLARVPGRDDIRFNVAHSEGLALYAFAPAREVGVDLERIWPLAQIDQIARQFFSPREKADLCSLDDGLREEAFYRCWTRKEAYIKARGQGLFLALSEFDVSLRPDEPARILGVRGEAQDASCWTLRELEPGAGYVGALAVQGANWQLSCWQYPSRKSPEHTAGCPRPCDSQLSGPAR
jgi:4'-phosphopantetheinyl transferase